jgi:hypothetical protein
MKILFFATVLFSLNSFAACGPETRVSKLSGTVTKAQNMYNLRLRTMRAKLLKVLELKEEAQLDGELHFVFQRPSVRKNFMVRSSKLQLEIERNLDQVKTNVSELKTVAMNIEVDMVTDGDGCNKTAIADELELNVQALDELQASFENHDKLFTYIDGKITDRELLELELGTNVKELNREILKQVRRNKKNRLTRLN